VSAERRPASASSLELEGLTRRFPGGAGVEDLSLQVEAGSILALLGPSGSGKTTTLRLLAGFETPDRGRILAGGDDVGRLAPAARRFGMVFQHYALFPHLDVGANVGFGLQGSGLGGADQERRIRESLESVDLGGFERRQIASLSGGQQQRVALARAIAPAPRVLLLDEPLSNLDPSLRERTRRELRQLIERIGITTVLVTHEQEEAFDLADRVAVLDGGRLQQVGTPEELYDRPVSPFVAGFVGRANVMDGEVRQRDDGAWHAVVGDLSFPIDASLAEGWRGEATLCVRPEAIRLVPDPDSPFRIAERRFLGATCLFNVVWGGGRLEVAAAQDTGEVGGSVAVAFGRRGVFLFPRTGP